MSEPVETKNESVEGSAAGPAVERPKPRRDWTGFWLLSIGILLACPYGVMSVLGWREYTSCFSGTYWPSDPGGIRGIGFAVAYLVAWVGTPIFAIAAGLCGMEWGIRRVWKW